MAQNREKFATQIDRVVLADIRMLAKDEGRQLQAIVEEALTALLGGRRQGKARPHAMSA